MLLITFEERKQMSGSVKEPMWKKKKSCFTDIQVGWIRGENRSSKITKWRPSQHKMCWDVDFKRTAGINWFNVA